MRNFKVSDLTAAISDPTRAVLTATEEGHSLRIGG
jgi:hypothetical protein